MNGALRAGGAGGMLTASALMVLLIAAPITLYQMVPLAKRSVAETYVRAAEAVRVETEGQSTDGNLGVLVDWTDIIAFDGVKRRQDLRGITEAGAKETTRKFTVRNEVHHTHCYDLAPPEEGTVCWPETHVSYTKRTLTQVMEAEGFTAEQKAWGYRLAAHAYLLRVENLSCQYDAPSEDWTCSA